MNLVVALACLGRVGAPFLPTDFIGYPTEGYGSAIAVAASLRLLPTRPKRPGASKGATTRFTALAY